MAGASTDEEGDYWPGYVDALTAMVKVLTFVMMLLAVAVFTISQKVAKQSLDEISKAVGVQIDPKAKPAEATAELVAKLKTRTEVAPGRTEPEPPPPMARTEPRPETVPEPPAVEPTPSPPPVIAALPQVVPPAEPPPAVEPEPAKPVAAPVPPAPVIENATAPHEPRPAAAALAEVADALITVKFKPTAVKVDPTTSEEIGRRLKTAPSGDVARFVVRGFAETSGGAVSEGRRLAFYRAMMVRQTLVAHGVPADHIVLNVRDTARNGEGEIVKVSVQ